MLKVLLIGAAILLLWRWMTKQDQPRLPRDPPTTPTGKLPWEVLGVDRAAPTDEIRTAYQRMISQYHPDKVADMGPELQALAEKHTKEINAAYSSMRKKG